MAAESWPSDVADALRDAFGWDGEVTVAPGPRGATSRIWRVGVGEARYALKEGRGEPPTAVAIDAEVAFVEAARVAGVRAPALHADRWGRRVLPGAGTSWLRLYDWVDVRPVDLGSPATPGALGGLLARLHRGAPQMSTEADGTAADPWYERPPRTAELLAAGAPEAAWSGRLFGRVAELPRLLELVRPVDPDRLLRCHRDLHPGNVLADASGGLVVIDQDDLGPADPARELAKVLFDWWSDPAPELDAMRATYQAYLDAGGPARVRATADFTMLVAARLNFLLRQLRLVADPATKPDDRAWAEQEIDESLRILPTVAHIGSVLRTLSSSADPRPARSDR